MKYAHLASALLLAASSSTVAAAEEMKCPLNAAYDPSNPFARIIRGEKEQAIVYSDPLVIAFVPNGWDNPGHVLIVPRRPVRNLDGLNDAEMLAVFHLIKRIAVAQERAFGSTGFTIEQNNARHQSVCHAHFHVIPNTPKESVDNATPAQMEAIAVKLRAALPQL
ncbi:MAG TPA: HIT family protein [Sphingomicrobium sp.]|nr:HIT family protein [Sphingomicrobium sp.]